MYRINRFFTTIICLILFLESTKQSHVKYATMTVKAIGKTIKSPLLRKIGNTIKKPAMKTFSNIKNSMEIFRRNKNTIKNLKYTTPFLNNGRNQLVRASGKQSIQMRSAAQIRGKVLRPFVKNPAGQMKGQELGSLINMLSRSKPQLPFLVGGGLMRLTQFNIVPANDKKDCPVTEDQNDKKQYYDLEEKYEKFVKNRVIPTDVSAEGLKVYTKVGEGPEEPIKVQLTKQVYEGKLVDGKRSGKGKLTFPDGNVYEGNFKENFMEGKGKLSIKSNGSIYEGDFVKDKATGKGKFTYDDGKIFEGTFKDDQITSPGMWTYKNGDIYEGAIKNGSPHGKGVITYFNGDKYEGSLLWHYDLHGKGKMTFKNGNVYEGDFKTGELTGEGLLKYKNGDKYEGEFNNGKLTGKGTQTNAKGEWCEASCVAGLMASKDV